MNRRALASSFCLLSFSAMPVAPSSGPSLELTGSWKPGDPDDNAFELELTVGGGVLDGTVGQVGVWIFGDPEWSDWNKRPASDPLLDAQVRFPCTLGGAGLPFTESGEAQTLYVFVEQGLDQFQSVITVPVRERARLKEFVEPVELVTATQPALHAKTGFELDTSGNLVFDFGTEDDDQLFKMTVPSGETVKELWLWAYTPEMPAGWPVPPASPNLHHVVDPPVVGGEYVLKVNADVANLSTSLSAHVSWLIS